MNESILLSICIPTYNRPKLLLRTLTSLNKRHNNIEIIVTDNSANNESELLVNKFLVDNNLKGFYHRNNFAKNLTPNEYLVKNFNQGIDLAKGKFIYILHDDDYLFENGLSDILSTLKNLDNDYHVIKFGVSLVDINENRIRDQTTNYNRYLAPRQSLELFLNNSSYIRFPSMIYRKSSFKSVGNFDVNYFSATDIDLYARMLSTYGLYEVSKIVAGYTIHDGAATMKNFNRDNIITLNRIFSRIKKNKIISHKCLKKSKSNFFHQFILAGTYRMIKAKNFSEAKRIYSLFQSQEINEIKPSIKWCFTKLTFLVVVQLGLILMPNSKN